MRPIQNDINFLYFQKSGFDVSDIVKCRGDFFLTNKLSNVTKMQDSVRTQKEGKIKKYTMVFMIMIIFMFATTLVSYTEAGGNCGSNCSKQCEHLGSGPEWARCVENCLKECLKNDPPPVPPVPPPTPVDPSKSKSDLQNFNSNFYANTEQDKVSTTIVVAMDSNDD